jgi:hypothetical protein
MVLSAEGSLGTSSLHPRTSLTELAVVGRQNAVRMKLNQIPPYKGTYAASVSSTLPPKCGILALQFHKISSVVVPVLSAQEQSLGGAISWRIESNWERWADALSGGGPPRVSMVQPTDARHGHNSRPGALSSCEGSGVGRIFVPRIVEAVRRVVVEVFANPPPPVGFIEPDDRIQHFSPAAPQRGFSFARRSMS